MVAATKSQRATSATKPETKRATLPATIFKLGIAALPLAPAIKINLDAAQGQGETWAVVGIGFVIFGAICIEHAIHAIRDRQAFSAALWGLLGFGFLALNLLNAIGDLSAHSDNSRDQNRARIDAAATISEQRQQWSQRRAEQAKIAGEETPDSIEAEARAFKAANAAILRASQDCDPATLYSDRAKTFCGALAKLDAKRAAATKRDEIDAKLARLDEKAETKGEAPSTVDSFADAVADGLNAFGYQIDEKGKLAIVRARDWGKSAGVELLAGFGPTALLLLFLRAGSPAQAEEAPRPVPSPRPAAKPASAPPVEPSATIATISTVNDSLHSFAVRRLERVDGEMVAAGAMWLLWKEDCEAHGVEPGTQQAFGRNLKKMFAHEKNNSRPRYLNVRVKAARPRLTVVNG